MEHLLILSGDGQYLPFARSQIKAIRATGQSYAARRWQMPEGDVGVRIVGEHEYIYLSGSKSLILMDSGFVEGYSLGASGYAPCVLYETSSVAAYSANFVPTDPVTEWRVGNPGLPTDAGQVSGILTIDKTSIRGKIPYDGGPARSFYPNRAVDPFDKDKTIPNPKDDALLAKKSMASGCPASIFTGKCRLYVQAMYGRFLYTASGGDMEAGPVLRPDDANPGATPALLIQSYPKDKETDPDPDEITLNTSTGLYLDKTTGKHWLIKILNGGEVWVYPLIGSAAAEPLRKRLVTEGPNAVPEVVASLTDEDREHLETEILSTCRPDGNSKMIASGAISGEAYSLGYGWHWNWDGTTTDIVLNYGTTDAKMSSTHYRGTVAPTRDDLGVITGWTASKVAVEGPKTWALYRLNWCLAEPLWGKRVLVKSTPKVATLHECDAPFYAFYNRNELKVCRVRVTLTPLSVGAKEWSPTYFSNAGSIAVHDVTSYLSLGLRGGWAKNFADQASYWTADFTFGSITAASGLTYGRARYGWRDVLDGKYLTGEVGGDGFINSYPYYTYTATEYFFGYPSGTPEVWESVYDRGVRHDGIPLGIRYTVEKSQLSEIYQSSATVIVPFNDAEAIFVQAAHYLTELDQEINLEDWHSISTSGGTWAELSYGVLEEGRPFNPITPPLDLTPDKGGKTKEYIKYGYHSHGTIYFNTPLGTTYPGNKFSSIPLVDYKKLICNAGAVDAVFDGLGKFHDNSEEFEEISDLYEVVSGTRTSTPSVHATGRITPVGFNGHDAAKPILVGWV